MARIESPLEKSSVEFRIEEVQQQQQQQHFEQQFYDHQFQHQQQQQQHERKVVVDEAYSSPVYKNSLPDRRISTAEKHNAAKLRGRIGSTELGDLSRNKRNILDEIKKKSRRGCYDGDDNEDEEEEAKRHRTEAVLQIVAEARRKRIDKFKMKLEDIHTKILQQRRARESSCCDDDDDDEDDEYDDDDETVRSSGSSLGGVGALDVSWPPKDDKEKKKNKKPKKLKVDWAKTIKKNQTEQELKSLKSEIEI